MAVTSSQGIRTVSGSGNLDIKSVFLSGVGVPTFAPTTTNETWLYQDSITGYLYRWSVLTLTWIKFPTTPSDIGAEVEGAATVVENNLEQLIFASELLPPVGFDNSNFPNDLTVFNNGSWRFNIEQFRGQSGKSVYVSVNTGNDTTGNGTRTAPYKSIFKAVNENADTIFIAPGIYTRYDSFNIQTVTKNLSIIKWPDIDGDVLLVAAQNLTWTLDGTYTNTYSSARSGVVDVVDGKNFDTNGDYLRLTLRNSIAEVNANESSWYTTGGIVYVHLRGNVLPDITTWAMISQNAKFEGDIDVYLEGLHFVGGGTSTPVYVTNTVAGQTTRLVAKDCQFSHGETNGLYALGATVYLENCESFANKLDGFNYADKNDTFSIAIELGCTGRHNGIIAGSNQGSTMHGLGRIIRVGGTYVNNQSQDIADVNGAHAWIVNSNTDGAPIGIRVDGADAKSWVDYTVVSNASQLVATSGATLKYRRAFYTNITGDVVEY
jgi:hypothetical protein